MNRRPHGTGPSLPIQCKQIHEAPSVLSAVQIKSTGDEGTLAWSMQKGGGKLHQCICSSAMNISCAYYVKERKKEISA